MTQSEQQYIEETSVEDFHQLWKMIWKTKSNKILKKHSFRSAEELFKKFKENTTLLKQLISLRKYKHLEWGFPKGRRLRKKNYFEQESDLECAKREFQEETSYEQDDYIILNEHDTYKEIFYGSDGILYAHVYFIALLKWDNHKIPYITETNYEVKKIEWICDLYNINIYQSTRNEIIKKILKYPNYINGL